MDISHSRDNDRKRRHLHVLSTNLQQIKEIPSAIRIKLVDQLKSSPDITRQRSNNWQKLCKKDPSILHLLIQLIT